MAKNTVEYYSSSLGSGVINNAASEATLREIVLAYNNMSGGDNNTISDTDDTIKATNKVLTSASKAFSSLAAGLVNTVTAGKNFTSMLARGEDKLSAYSRFLEQDVIKKLPVVGDALGGFASIITTSISILESWNDDLKQATKYGATFGNDMFEFKESALRMGLSTDELISLIAENSEKIVAFGGGTVTSGMRNFSRMSEVMFMENSAVSDILDRMGYSSQQQNELLLDFNWSSRRGKAFQEHEFNTTSKQFLAYASQLDVYTKLTGKSRVDRMKAAAAASQDISYQLSVGKLGDQQQIRMETALNGFAMIFGAEGAELFKARHLNVTTMNDTALALSIALGPDFDKALGEIQRLAKTKDINPDVFNKAVNSMLGDQLANAKRAVDRLNPLLKAAAAGNEQAKKTTKALTPVMEYLVRQGKLSDDVRGQFIKQIEAIKNEQKDADAFADVLRKFQRAVMKVHLSFMRTLLPVFKDLAKEFKIAMIPQMINDFGKQLQIIARDSLPYIQNFFANITSPEGITMMGDTFFLMMDWLKYQINYFIRSSLEDLAPDLAVRIAKRFGWIEDSKKYKERAEKTGEQIQKNLRSTIEPGMKSVTESGTNTQDTTAEPLKIATNDKNYFIESLKRGASGHFQYLDSEFAASSSASDVKDPGVIEKILAERELRAKDGKAPLDPGPEKFGGLSLLEREALLNVIDMNLPGVGMSYFPLKRVISDPALFETAGARNSYRINQLKKRPEYESELQRLRIEFPNTYLGMNTGTLGRFGSLFANFGKGTRATLHGKEAIVTPKQLQSVIGAGTQISVRDVVNRLNTNINLMISVAKEDVRLERSKLMAMT
jgi:hypothetical protein